MRDSGNGFRYPRRELVIIINPRPGPGYCNFTTAEVFPMTLPFLRLAVIAAVFAFGASNIIASDGTPDAYWVYFGTYTNGKPDGSKGIYRSKMDTKTGK